MAQMLGLEINGTYWEEQEAEAQGTEEAEIRGGGGRKQHGVEQKGCREGK